MGGFSISTLLTWLFGLLGLLGWASNNPPARKPDVSQTSVPAHAYLGRSHEDWPVC